MFLRCFPHIVNLACKAALSAMTKLAYAASQAEDHVPPDYAAGLDRDPIATIRSFVCAVSQPNEYFSRHLAVLIQVRSSSIRRQYLTSVLEILNQKNLQLLRDIDIRWSSTLLMIERALLLREVIRFFFTTPIQADLASRQSINFLTTMNLLSYGNTRFVRSTGRPWKRSRKFLKYIHLYSHSQSY